MLRTGDTVLGELESQVLEHFWREREGDAKQVHDALGKDRGITLNTVQSAMKRLFEKGLLARRKVSHAHVYSARVTKEELGRTVLGGVVDRFMQGEASMMVAAFVDLVDQAGEEHLDELERLIRERRKSRKDRGSR